MSTTEAILEVDGKRVFARIYYMELTRSNWMAAIFRSPDGPWEVGTRQRFYVDAKNFGSDDPKKEVWSVAPDGSAQSLELLKGIIEKFIAFTKEKIPEAKLTILELDTADPDVLYRELAKQPWAHIKLQGTSPGGSA